MTASPWVEQLQPASFRDVPFLVDGHDTEFGRRVAVHEYPFQDLPETEDLGLRPRILSLYAYVLGPDYFSARDQLSAALEQPGSGWLVHPYLGRVQVTLLQVRLSETTREGGLARFDLRFIAVSTVTAPTATVDTQAGVMAASTAAQGVADQNLQTVWSISTSGAQDAVTAALDNAFSGIEGAIPGGQNGATLAQQLVALPAQVTARMDADMRRIGTLAGLLPFFSYTPPSPIGFVDGAPTIAALGLQVQATATFAAAELTSQTTYASYDDAIAARDVVLAQIDAVSENADAALYLALQDLRVAVATDIDTRAANLAVITQYTPVETLPALVIAQRLYGPTNIEAMTADIVARNAIANPGFVPGGVTLEVLSD